MIVLIRQCLAEAIPTVCERVVPRDIEERERQVTCHRYDPTRTGDPLARIE